MLSPPRPSHPLLLAAAVLAIAPFSAGSPLLQPRASSVELNGFYNVSAGGGSWLTGNTGGDGGEPINVVIAANSDPSIFALDVFLDFMVSIDMAGECLGQHDGNIQTANLGDGNGYVNSTTLRYDYGDPSLGTCKETILGGNHLRYFNQNGSQADSGAWFMSVSYEQNLTFNHNIYLPDGYAFGRDLLTGNATAPGGTRSPLTNRTFTTTSTPTPGFFPPNSSVDINHGIEYDGIVDVWVVKVTSNGSVAASSSTGDASSLISQKGLIAISFSTFLASAILLIS